MKEARKLDRKRTGGNGRHTERVRPAATTDVILGPFHARGRFNPELARVPRKWQKHYRQLVSMRERLLEELRQRGGGDSEPLHLQGLHPADVAADDFDQTFRLSLLSAKQELLYEIEDALRRIENDTYGICELTGKRISAKRLEAVPWARFSEEAEAELEKQGALHGPRLGELALTALAEENRTLGSEIEAEEEETVPAPDKLEDE